MRGNENSAGGTTTYYRLVALMTEVGNHTQGPQMFPASGPNPDRRHGGPSLPSKRQRFLCI